MSSLTKTVAKNTFIQVGGRFLSLVLGLVVISLMMRYLGPEQYGYYSISIAFLQIAGIIADFGLYLMTLQYLGEADMHYEITKTYENTKEGRASFVMQNIFTLRLFSAISFYGLAFVVSLFFPYPWSVKIGILILSLAMFFSTLIQILSAFYQKIFQAIKIVWGELLGRLALLVAIVLFIQLKLNFYSVIAIFVLGSGVNFLFLWLSASQWIKLRLRFDFPFWREIIIRSWPIGLGIIFNTIYFKADTVILSLYRPAAEVGIYGACYRVLEILITFPPLFLGLVFAPIAAAWASNNIERFKTLLQKSFDFLAMLALPIIFSTLVLGPRLMKLIGGPEFERSGEVLRVIIVAAGVLFVAELFKQTVINLNQQKLTAWFYFLTAAISMVGYFVFIPRYSYWGAAWMTVVGEILMLVCLLWVVWRKARFLPNLRFFGKSFLASLTMFFVLHFFIRWNLFVLLFLAVPVYFCVLYLLRGIPKIMIKEIIAARPRTR